jgi:hypothetical protein
MNTANKKSRERERADKRERAREEWPQMITKFDEIQTLGRPIVTSTLLRGRTSSPQGPRSTHTLSKRRASNLDEKTTSKKIRHRISKLIFLNILSKFIIFLSSLISPKQFKHCNNRHKIIFTYIHLSDITHKHYNHMYKRIKNFFFSNKEKRGKHIPAVDRMKGHTLRVMSFLSKKAGMCRGMRRRRQS